MTDEVDVLLGTGAGTALQIEQNGINVIGEAERKGSPRQLFWPWFGANISVLGLSYGSWVLGFGISFWQAVIVGAIGIVFSFLLCGFIALAGQRGSAPTMTLSRAAFGLRGNALPSGISWILCVGWETILCVLAVKATVTVFGRLGWSNGVGVKVAAMILIGGLIVGGGVLGFDAIMRLQAIITIATGILTVLFIALSANHVHWHAVSGLSSGGFQAVLGGLIFVMTGFGLGWVNAAADYSRYLPRSASKKGIVGWTTFGAAIAPLVLLFFGLLLAGSSTSLNSAISNDPVGALANLLPSWFLFPFALVAILGLVGGAVLDIYSSGLSMLAMGIKIPRFASALVDGALMLAGTIYLVFSTNNFFWWFEGFLITIGVLIAAWCGVFLADLTLRKKNYDDDALFDASGRYGSIQIVSVLTILVSAFLGWGLVTNGMNSWWSWQGYLLDLFGLGGKSGAWAYANLGVLVALVLSYVATLLLTKNTVARQEAQ